MMQAFTRSGAQAFRWWKAVAVVAGLTVVSPAARADVLGNGFDRFLSNEGTYLLVGAGALLPLVEDGRQGRNHTVRAVDSLAVTAVLTEGLKAVVREERPYGGGFGSFPSGHTSVAFCAATMQSALHPRQAPLWYLGATLIGVSRVDLKAHHWYDVVAGGLLGYGVSRWELSQRHGLILRPLISADARGVEMRASF